MNNSPVVRFLAVALLGIAMIIVLAVAFIRLTDPTRDTVNTAPPENEVRQPRAPEPATSTAPGAPRPTEPPPIFSTETNETDTGNTP